MGPFIEPLGRLHRVVCPRQVLGVRIALLAARALDVPFPQADKRSLILPEIDGCFADGLMVVSNCSIGHRTLRVVSLGGNVVQELSVASDDVTMDLSSEPAGIYCIQIAEGSSLRNIKVVKY